HWHPERRSHVSFTVTLLSIRHRHQAPRCWLRLRGGRGAAARFRGPDAGRPRPDGGPAGRRRPPRTCHRLGGVLRPADNRRPRGIRPPPPYRVPRPPGRRPRPPGREPRRAGAGLRPAAGCRRRPVLRLGGGGGGPPRGPRPEARWSCPPPTPPPPGWRAPAVTSPPPVPRCTKVTSTN